MPVEPDSELYHALYDNDYGDADFFEAQIMDPVPTERIPVLHRALSDPDPYVSYQAARLLCAWAHPAGLSQIEKYIDEADNLAFDKDWRTGRENSLDKIAEAIGFSRHNGIPVAEINRLFKKLLALYPQHLFKGLFQSALLRWPEQSLLPDMVSALEATIVGDPYQASHLLPAIANCDPNLGWHYAQRFFGLDRAGHNPLLSMTEALGYINTDASREKLAALTQHHDERVSDLAKQSLARQASAEKAANSPHTCS